MTTRTHRYLLVALLAIASFGWSACSASDKLSSSASAAEAVRMAGQQAGSESHAFEMTINVRVAGIGGLEMAMEGQFDAATNFGRVTTDFLGMDIEVITDGATTYTRTGGADEWFKVEVELPQPFFAGSGFDATQPLAYLRMVSDNVTEAGTERIRGRETTKYRAFVSFERVFEQISGEDLELMGQLSELLNGNGFDMLVWIDTEERPAKIEYSMDMEIEGSTFAATYVMEFFDWGRNVTIELPPADKVVDAPAFGLFGG